MKAKQTLALLAVFTLLAVLPEGRAEDKNIFFPEASVQSLYVFSEHLQDANAEIYLSNKENRKGIWEHDQFRFYGMDAGAQISLVSGQESEGDNPWQAIEINSLPHSYRKLQFLNIPAARILHLYYKSELPPEFVQKNPKQNVYIYFSIFAGKKLIRQIRISSQDKGWQQETVSFGILGLLNRNFPLTFGLTGNDASEVNVQFFAEALQ